MNGKPLSRDHGLPIRVIVPGYIGARSVKFLQKILIQPQESNSFFQRKDYKILPPWVNNFGITTRLAAPAPNRPVPFGRFHKHPTVGQRCALSLCCACGPNLLISNDGSFLCTIGEFKQCRRCMGLNGFSWRDECPVCDLYTDGEGDHSLLEARHRQGLRHIWRRPSYL